MYSGITHNVEPNMDTINCKKRGSEPVNTGRDLGFGSG